MGFGESGSLKHVFVSEDFWKGEAERLGKRVKELQTENWKLKVDLMKLKEKEKK